MTEHPDNVRRLAIVTYLVVLAVLTGCERPPAPGEKSVRTRNPHVVFVGMLDGDPRWGAIESGARGLIRNYQDVRFTALHPLDDSPAALEAACRNVVQLGASAACVWIPRPNEHDRAMQSIVSAGVALITVGPHQQSEANFAHVQCSPLDAAEILGERLSELAGESRSYVLLHDSGRSAFDTDVQRRFDHGAGGAFGMRKLTEAYAGGGNLTQAEEALAGLLRMFPNVGLVVTLDPRLWSRDPQAVQLSAANRYLTLSAAPVLWPGLRSGRAAGLVGWIDGEIGRAAADFAIRSLGERKNTGRMLVMKPELVTRETLDDFVRRYESAAGWEASTSGPTSRSGGNVGRRPVEP